MLFGQFEIVHILPTEHYGHNPIRRKPISENQFQKQSDIRRNHHQHFHKSVFNLQQNKMPQYYAYRYIRTHQKIRFDDAPTPIYGFTVRTRQMFSCENNLAKECLDLEARGEVVECKQNRFR